MELEENEILKLQQFLSEEMNASEREVFQKEIETSQKLKEFLTIYKQINGFNTQGEWNLYQGNNDRLKEALSLFQNKETKAFSEKIKGIEKENVLNKPKNQISWLRVAMGFAIVASFAILLYMSFFQNPSLHQLYINNSSWEDLPSFTVKGDAIEEQKIALEQFFREKKYGDAIALSNKILKNSEILDPNILIYKGVSLIETNDLEEALQVFDKLIAQKNLIDFHKGYWYKVLIYLKANDKKNALQMLEIINKNPLFYKHKQAKELLKKIK